MLDTLTSKGRIVAAALQLAGERAWSEVTLGDIAEAAGTTLVELRKDFSSKAGILVALTRAVDDEVLRRAPQPAQGQARRDALFEVLMMRLDVLAPYKPALRSIVQSGGADPAHARALLASQHWMLQAAGVDTSGLAGAIRVAGLASVYASVVRTWLADDDPGQARTMAALDRRLRSGERSLRTLDDACGAVRWVGDMVRGGARRARSTTTDAGAPPPAADPV
jgi:AcrR family transcriptional regulator